ncbi:MAG TPA: hypothetical protein VKP30_15730 [Polyangiaceae bacterium]|nr:hypothetical protein [Polyangiaceae bacterium]
MRLRRGSRTLSCNVRKPAMLAIFGLACSSGNDVLVGYNRDVATSGRPSSTASNIAGGGALNTATQPSFGGTQSGTTTTTTSAPGTCDNGGPAVALPTLGGCTNDLAKRIFLFAICTCSDFVANASVVTEPFRASTTGFNLGASIGVNGTYRAEGAASHLGGSLWVLGNAAFEQHDVLGELVCGSSVTVSSVSDVGRNAYVGGNLSAPNLTIDGTLSISPDAQREVKAVAGGTQFITDTTIPTPCDCRTPIDIAGVARHFRDDNDNARVSLPPSAFTATDRDVEYTLACGRYYFDSFGGTGAVSLHITGKTLIAVGGQLSNSGGITFDLAPEAELDLFIAGDLELSGMVSMGNATRPAATRVYVGGQAAFSTDLKLYANWYIPNSQLAMSAPSEFWGSLYSRSLQSAAGLTVHYDDAVLDLPSCNPAGQSCTSCHDCANPTPACRNGRCEACAVDSDCCPPLYCHQGTCRSIPYLI